MSKKIISVVLAVVLAFSMIAVAAVSVSATLDDNGRYVPSCSIEETNRYYFWLPESWKSEKFGADSAGAYWWGGTDSCEEFGTEGGGAPWPGYKIQVADEKLGVYYLDCPKDVEMIVFNNFLNGGTREETEKGSGVYTYQLSEEQYFAAIQTIDTACNYYSEGDNDLYDNLLDGEFFALADEAVTGDDKTFLGNFVDNFFIEEEYGISMNFDNMICIPDLSHPIPNPLNGKDTYPTEWYFYYGDGKYGSLPVQEMAEALTTEENPLVFDLNKPVVPATPDEDDNNNGNNGNNGNGGNGNVPAPATNPTSASGPQAGNTATGDTVKADNNAIQTGAASMVVVALTILAVAAGAVLFTRKRYE